MTIPRENGNPYGAFNFQVFAEPLGNNDGSSMRAGFQEISTPSMEVTEAEYRTGNDLENHVRKMNGLYKVTDITLKRGIAGWNDFFDWIKKVGDGDPNQRKDVRIELKNEAHTETVMTWVLYAAKPKSYKGATLNAKGGTDVALEELVLSYEKLEVK